MGLSNIYADAIKNELKYFCIWEPGQHLELGDFGYLEDNIFKLAGNLKDKGIKIKKRTNKRKTYFTFHSQNSVNIDIGTNADVAGVAKACLKISFSKENAIFFNAPGCTSMSITNNDDIGNELINLRDKGDWKMDYVVVVERIVAKNAQVVISKSSDSEIVFEAVSPEITKIDLADANAKLTYQREKNIGYKFLGEDCTILQSLWKLEKKPLRKPNYVPADRGIQNIPETEYKFEKLEP